MRERPGGEGGGHRPSSDSVRGGRITSGSHRTRPAAWCRTVRGGWDAMPHPPPDPRRLSGAPCGPGAAAARLADRIEGHAPPFGTGSPKPVLHRFRVRLRCRGRDGHRLASTGRIATGAPALASPSYLSVRRISIRHEVRLLPVSDARSRALTYLPARVEASRHPRMAGGTEADRGGGPKAGWPKRSRGFIEAPHWAARFESAVGTDPVDRRETRSRRAGLWRHDSVVGRGYGW